MIRVLLWLLSVVALVEVGVRSAGLVDFPLYVRNEQFGYAPRPSQAGMFLRRNQWVFNDRGLAVAEPWVPSERTDILLIGNSVVAGGNWYDQNEKLTSRLRARLGVNCPIWPIAAGAWTTVNALGFLEANLELVEGADFFVWQMMPGQLEHLNAWMSETLHPTTAPAWATTHVAQKLLRERFSADTAARVPVTDMTAENLRRLDRMVSRLTARSSRRPKGLLVLYPDRHQLAIARSGVAWNGDRDDMRQLASRNGLAIVDMALEPQWSAAMYRDPIHPTPEGNDLLASIVADALRGAVPALDCAGRP